MLVVQLSYLCGKVCTYQSEPFVFIKWRYETSELSRPHENMGTDGKWRLYIPKKKSKWN